MFIAILEHPYTSSYERGLQTPSEIILTVGPFGSEVEAREFVCNEHREIRKAGGKYCNPHNYHYPEEQEEWEELWEAGELDGSEVPFSLLLHPNRWLVLSLTDQDPEKIRAGYDHRLSQS